MELRVSPFTLFTDAMALTVCRQSLPYIVHRIIENRLLKTDYCKFNNCVHNNPEKVHYGYRIRLVGGGCEG